MPETETGNIFQPKKVGLVAFSHFTHDVYTSFLAVLMPYLLIKFGMSYSSGGFLYFLLEIPSLAIPLIGIYINKYKMKYIVALTPALSAVAMSFVPAVPSFLHVCVLVVIAGVSSTAYHIPAPVMIRRFAGDKIGTGMSFFMFGGELARMAGPLMIYYAVEWWGLEGSYRVVLPGIATSIALFLMVRKIKDNCEDANKSSGFFSVMKRKRSLFVAIAGFLVFKAFMWKALTSFLPAYLTSKGGEMWFAASALSILELAGAAGAFMSGTISDRLGRKRTLLLVASFSPPAMLLFILSGGWTTFILLIVLGLLNMSINPIILALVQDSETESPTIANSVFMGINFLISSLTVFLFGFISDMISIDYVYYLSAGLYVLGIPFLMALPGKRNLVE